MHKVSLEATFLMPIMRLKDAFVRAQNTAGFPFGSNLMESTYSLFSSNQGLTVYI
jgi:hypothetical protein